MNSGPVALLDKSAFQGLSRAELDAFRRLFRETVTPILIFEVLGDLAKTGSSAMPRARVSELASRLINHFGAVNESYRNVCFASLLGARFDFGRGPLPDNYVSTEHGVVVRESPFDAVLRRWARNDFSLLETNWANGWRESTRSMSFRELVEQLRKHHVLFPRPRDSGQVVAAADQLLSNRTLQTVLLDWLLTHLNRTTAERRTVLGRWDRSGVDLLEDFAPYAHHCLRVLLSLVFAVHHNHLGWNSTHALDAQYLYYLPFCEVFISDDRLHRLLAPQLLSGKQSFIAFREMKPVMRALLAQLSPTNDALIRSLWARHRPGMRVPELPRSPQG